MRFIFLSVTHGPIFDFIQASLFGATLAPISGGVVANYFSWRVMQYAIGVAGVFSFFLMFRFLPETSHPGERGIDKRPESDFGWVWLNPLKFLWLLRSPNLLALVSAPYLRYQLVQIVSRSLYHFQRYFQRWVSSPGSPYVMYCLQSL